MIPTDSQATQPADSRTVPVTHMGPASIQLNSQYTTTIPKAVTIPNLKHNLLSVSQLTNNYDVLFKRKTAYILARHTKQPQRPQSWPQHTDTMVSTISKTPMTTTKPTAPTPQHSNHPFPNVTHHAPYRIQRRAKSPSNHMNHHPALPYQPLCFPMSNVATTPNHVQPARICNLPSLY